MDAGLLSAFATWEHTGGEWEESDKQQHERGDQTGVAFTDDSSSPSANRGRGRRGSGTHALQQGSSIGILYKGDVNPFLPLISEPICKSSSLIGRQKMPRTVTISTKSVK